MLTKSKIMKKLTFVFLLLVLLVALVIFRLTDRNDYKNNVPSLLETVKNHTNIIPPERVDNSFLVVDLGGRGLLPDLRANNRIVLAWDNLLKQENLELLQKPGQKVALVSGDVATSIKVFAILHQKGVENLFIVEPGGGSGEVLKYKFAPNTSFEKSVGNEEKLE